MMKFCSQCNQQNPDDANFCHQCGAALTSTTVAAETVTDIPNPIPIQNDEALWRQFIGPNADQYLAQFKKFSSNGQPKFALSWNWPAFLFISFLWFLYRKMYLHAFVYAVGPMISTYLTGDLYAGIVWSIMAGATANYLFYWHCREHIAAIKKAGWSNQPVQVAALKESGGVQPYVIWVGVVLYIIFLATLVKIIQEGPPDSDKVPGRPAKQAAASMI
ncbi:MAG: DUF2628 domain-containing protein [Nitrospirae bacterium]|nr:DUF2628 domain-containing protein [Nitrospirota bacterium]